MFSSQLDSEESGRTALVFVYVRVGLAARGRMKRESFAWTVRSTLLCVRLYYFYFVRICICRLYIAVNSVELNS